MKLSSKLDEYLSKEEDLSRQKSREVWLNKGDRIKKIKINHSSTINRGRKKNQQDGKYGRYLAE